jgi:hypothetical protein
MGFGNCPAQTNRNQLSRLPVQVFKTTSNHFVQSPSKKRQENVDRPILRETRVGGCIMKISSKGIRSSTCLPQSPPPPPTPPRFLPPPPNPIMLAKALHRRSDLSIPRNETAPRAQIYRPNFHENKPKTLVFT